MVAVPHPSRVPLYMDRHEFSGLTAEDVFGAHLRDLDAQDAFGVQFLNYWFDDVRQTAFCLVRAPSPEAVAAVHAAAHGLIPNQIIEIDQAALEQFMGEIVSHQRTAPYVATAFRTIVFTDMEDSTGFTRRLGDAGAMAVVRAHDRIVREALGHHGGSEVKHTGDGLMAAFASVAEAVKAATQMQRELSSDAVASKVRVRIGIAAGEPVTESDDLFGAAVQLAARLCQRAEPGTILVSSAVRELVLGKRFVFGKPRRLRLKGFDEPQLVYEVIWRVPPKPATAATAATST